MIRNILAKIKRKYVRLRGAMDEGRKRVLLIATAIIAARRLAQLDFKPCPAYEVAIGNAILAAEKILRRIDANWPERKHDRDF